jgi:tetratricopeptide (TPR) repeat protein
METKAGIGLGIPKPEEIPPFVIDELKKDIKTINQRLEKFGIPTGAILTDVKLKKEIPKTLKYEIELIQAKIDLTGDFYGIEKPVSYFISLGNFYYESNEYEKAIEQYDKVLEKEPENDDALFNRGRAHIEKGDADKGVEDYTIYIEKINPRNASAYYNRGVAYYKLKQYEKEEEDYKKALELNQNAVFAMLNLSELYIITKNYAGAHEMAERALNVAEGSEDIIISHFLIVCSSLFQNKNEDAKSQLNILIDYLEKIKDWTLKWDFPDIASAIESSDVEENLKSLILSLIELLENF